MSFLWKETESLMGIDAFMPGKTDRDRILYEAIKPYIKDGMDFLDVGCAYGVFCEFLHKDFPKANLAGFDNNGELVKYCQGHYPYFSFHRIHIPDEINSALINMRYDFILHAGVDSWQFSDIWKVHKKLRLFKPDFILLETGWKSNYLGPRHTLEEVVRLYKELDYRIEKEGDLIFDNDGGNPKDRIYTILAK